MPWTLCTSGSAIHRAGADANSTITTSGSALADYSTEAEAYISTTIRYDVVTNYGNITVNGKQIFQNLCANIIAKKIVNYSLSGYSKIGEAVTIMNVLDSEIDDLFKFVKEDKYKTYLGITPG